MRKVLFLLAVFQTATAIAFLFPQNAMSDQSYMTRVGWIYVWMLDVKTKTFHVSDIVIASRQTLEDCGYERFFNQYLKDTDQKMPASKKKSRINWVVKYEMTGNENAISDLRKTNTETFRNKGYAIVDDYLISNYNSRHNLSCNSEDPFHEEFRNGIELSD